MNNLINSLKNISVQSIDKSEDIKKTFFDSTANKFPIIIQPIRNNLSLSNWIKSNREEYDKLLNTFGAILFRGFGINTVDSFQSLTDEFKESKLEYKFRSSPRYSIKNNVYVSTTYPSDQPIEMHSESSYAETPPSKIIFCCITKPEQGGETPISDTRKTLKYLPDELRQKFLDHGVMYKRNLSKTLGLAWEEVFQLDDKSEVEKKCKELGVKYLWNGDDLAIEWVKKAIWKHPESNELCWFNHSLFFNKFSLQDEILDVIKSDNQLPSNTFFGNGSEISKEEIHQIQKAYEKAKVIFPWQEGDVLFLDNMLMAHGRNPFVGDRKIIVSMY